MIEPTASGPSPKVDPGPDPRRIGAARFDWRDPYHVALTLSWRAFAGAALAAIALINAVFAVLYTAAPGAVQNLRPGDVFMAFFFSLETLSTVGYGEMAPGGLYGHALAGAEIVVGMAFTAVMTGLVFVRFSRPRARFLFADRLVIASHNGRRTLMLRLANARSSDMTSAQASLGVVLAEVTAEGRPFQSVRDLALARSKIPIFPPAWTIMHVIDTSSPLHGVTREQLGAMAARFYVAVEGHDTVLQAIVKGMRTYAHTDIAYGMRYVDMITSSETGQNSADLAKLGALEPGLAAAAPGAVGDPR